MLPYIFPEIYEHILSQLPVVSSSLDPSDESTSDSSTRALAMCAAANSTLRDIACLSHIWKPHYLARWTHHRELDRILEASSSSSTPSDSSDSSESHPRPRRSLSRATSAPDYRKLYIARRLKDSLALRALDRIVANRAERHALSLELVDVLGKDVWDVLKAQKARLTVPKSFREEEKPKEDWFARSHWIDEITGAITRRDAMMRVISLSDGDDMPLDEGLSVFSGFWGIEYDEIKSKLDQLASECEEHMRQQRIELNPSERGYDRVSVSLEICTWMGLNGFLPAVDTYHDLRNHYIHKVLSTHRKTLPLSLVSIFVAIARRLGIPASAVGFPGHVHAFVPLDTELAPRSPFASYYDAVQRGIHVDVYHHSTTPFINIMEKVRAGADVQSQLKVSSTHDMVFRAGKNILTSAQLHQTEISSWELDLSVYAVFCVFLLEQQHSRTPARDFVSHIMAIVAQNYPLDIGPLLQQTLAPALSGHSREMLEKECAKLVMDEAEVPVPAERRPVRFFSGLVFVHRIFDYIAVILEGDDHCHASNAWIIRFGIDALERGRNQPFYTVCAADGSSRYVAEDNIIPIASLLSSTESTFNAHSVHIHRTPDAILRGLVEGFSGLGRHFLLPIQAPAGRLVFRPHPETFVRFPEDEKKLETYLKEGAW